MQLLQLSSLHDPLSKPLLAQLPELKGLDKRTSRGDMEAFVA